MVSLFIFIKERQCMRLFRRFFSLVLCISLILLSSESTFAAQGEGNIDGGGGHVNQGIEGYKGPTGYEGVRITVVDAESGQQLSTPIDLSNYDVSAVSASIFNFGKISKIQYRNGAALNIQGTYQCYQPDKPIPKIISTNSGKADINAIKSYFCSEGAASMVALYTGISESDISSGKYKLVVEPIIYLWYKHLFFAMTVTEAGLYNRATGGDFGSHFPTVVMKNFALSMFLERDDLGFQAYTGPKGSARTTNEMISILGIGIVSYAAQPDGVPPVTETEYDQVYRVNTDVITAVSLYSDREINNRSKAAVSFRIKGITYQMTDIVIPEGGSQLVWVKWHTPSTPQDITITISANKGTLSTRQMTVRVVDLNENPPPDPQANDRNDSYRLPEVPGKTDVTELSWGEWDCWWQSHWVYHSGGVNGPGNWCDHGWYEFDWIPYYASITATMSIKPDAKNPTAEGRIMKSGYGINMKATARLSSDAPSTAITGAQNVVAYFPEFSYQTYWRLLERMTEGYTSSFEFQKNQYSTYSRRSHFCPIWFPDGPYEVYGEVLDAWTPAGMLKVNLTDELTVRDNLFSDWHIRPAD